IFELNEFELKILNESKEFKDKENEPVTSIFYIDNTEIKIPLYFYKDCGFYYGVCNKDLIEITINSKNDILIDGETPLTEEEFINVVFELNKKYHNEYSKKSISYLIEWNNGEWEEQSMKKLIKNLLIGVNKFYDKYSVETYDKKLKKCSIKEKHDLFNKFMTNITIYPYFINHVPPPPPPPPNSVEIGNHNFTTIE
ncbi:hypothetical protein Q4595_14010, partial [Wenyingzhuangia sp. 1_MG-2023]|nr:hypothetical protein [Wenyingzhuangia sp. 1_MG-2023]